MKLVLFALSAVSSISLASCAQAKSLERQDRQDTIYDVRGDPKALKQFHADVGLPWTGGTALDDDPSDGLLSYWAYSYRTAAEARALMMPAILGGLELEPKGYSESARYPVERKKLDEIALACGAKLDPFFVTPRRTVEVTRLEGVGANVNSCLLERVRADAAMSITIPRQGSNKN